MKSQAIVIPCYNRIKPLKRLLDSLHEACYTTSIDLVFSIDYSGNNDIEVLCDKFEWKHGNKKIIKYTENIGLRANILNCGDLLITEYERIILLEDDLYVSPYFCKYALLASDFYEKDDNIAGISLYAYAKSEVGLFNFYPLKDEMDTFFMQWPSSWGQLWTRKHWLAFREWLDFNIDFTKINIPDYVKTWKNSWKKYYSAYLVQENKYFVFPYISYTIEGGEPGTHVAKSSSFSLYDAPLSYNTGTFRFREFKDSNKFKYDCFFQPCERQIKIGLKKYHVSFDLYGTKKYNNIETEYVITSKNCKSIEYGFDNLQIPFELNIMNCNNGKFFFLTSIDNYKNSVFDYSKKLPLRMTLSTKEQIRYLFRLCFSKLKRTVLQYE